MVIYKECDRPDNTATFYLRISNKSNSDSDIDTDSDIDSDTDSDTTSDTESQTSQKNTADKEVQTILSMPPNVIIFKNNLEYSE